MKKTAIICLVLSSLLMTGCYSTINVTSKARLDKAIVSAEQSLKQMGYKKTGLSTGNNTEVTRSEGFIYMQNVGVIPYTEEEKNVTTIDNYSYADDNGNTLSYSIAYESKVSHDKIWYVENVRFAGCSTNNPDNYEQLCTDKSPILQIVETGKPDKVTIYNETGTWIAVLTPILVAEVVFLAWLLSRP